MSLALHSEAIDCAWLLAEPGLRLAQAGMRIALDGERFGAIAPRDAAGSAPRLLALPALANAHDLSLIHI